ncbi:MULTISPECIES: hypothetical protein [Flavobacterium]|uniref:Uncharacterized protein n=1 Tax=Flavobacterium hankyongi TaxID=1176532 RepID=A0ABP8ZR39_9FLAO|nr:hypothetical protein [Flavobacterium sp. N1846]
MLISRNSKLEIQKLKATALLFVAYFLLPVTSNAQCAMCRASLESTGDVSQAEAVNDGIVYLMVIPYVLVALIGFAVYKMFQKKKIS